MKILKFLLAGVIALGLMACNNEEVPDMTGEKDATISIKVFPSSNGPTVRTTGDLTGNGISTTGLPAESAIKSLEVWIFHNSGVLIGYKKAEATEGGEVTEVTDIEASIGEGYFVVIANANIGSRATMPLLKAELGALPANVATNGLIMTANPVDVTLVKGKNYYGYTDAEVLEKIGDEKNHLNDSKKPLAITRVNARVAIVSAVLDMNSVPENQKTVFDALKNVQVAMFNVPEKTHLFYTDTRPTWLATDTDYLFGAKWPSPATTYVGANDPAATPTGSLTDNVVGLPVFITDAPYYYVNESSVENKMFIVLRAQVMKGEDVVTSVTDLYTDSEGYTYYPIWVNGKDLGYDYGGATTDGKVVRNTQYNISLTIKGLGNPTIDPVDKAWLDVKVEVAPWLVVSQNVTW